MKGLKGRPTGYIFVFVGSLLFLAGILGFQPIAERTETYLERSVKSVLATYIVVRGLNAGVSVIKESELSLSPAGVGVSIAFGEILDPLDDATERVSSLILVSFISLGVQALMVDLLSQPILILTGVLSVALGLYMAVRDKVPPVIPRVLLMFIVLRFFFPISLMVGEFTYDLAVKERVEEAKDQLTRVKGEIVLMTSGLKDPSQLEKLPSKAKDLADRSVESLLTLALAFTFQTIIMPILFAYLTLKLAIGTLRLKL